MLFSFIVGEIEGDEKDDAFIVAPMNKVAFAGESFEMECRPGNGWSFSRWALLEYYSPSSSIRYYFYDIENPLKWDLFDFVVDKDGQGSYFLYVQATGIEHSGIYECYAEKDGKELMYSAALTVLGAYAYSRCWKFKNRRIYIFLLRPLF